MTVSSLSEEFVDSQNHGGPDLTLFTVYEDITKLLKLVLRKKE